MVYCEQMIPASVRPRFRRHVHVHEERQIKSRGAVPILLEIDQHYILWHFALVAKQHIVPVVVSVENHRVLLVPLETTLHQFGGSGTILAPQCPDTVPYNGLLKQCRLLVEVTKESLKNDLEHDIVAFEEYFSILQEVKGNDLFDQPAERIRLSTNTQSVGAGVELGYLACHKLQMGGIADARLGQIDPGCECAKIERRASITHQLLERRNHSRINVDLVREEYESERFLAKIIITFHYLHHHGTK
uniref:Uncharacterized protein n=1 Tax=Anopheles merus TaxID=30066 RepID=A0A182UMP0_ANOME